MHHPVKITVTRAHINKGQRAECSACPIALAINEVLPANHRSSVDDESVSIHNIQPTLFGRTFLYSSELPEVAQQFVDQFDAHDPHNALSTDTPPGPFEFEIDLP